MGLDLHFIAELGVELGLQCEIMSSDEVRFDLGSGAILMFKNKGDADDSLVGFVGTTWHLHGRLTCMDRHGNYTEVPDCDIVSGIKDGSILICELWRRGDLADRWLVHRDYVDEFRSLQDGEEIRIRREGGETPAVSSSAVVPSESCG